MHYYRFWYAEMKLVPASTAPGATDRKPSPPPPPGIGFKDIDFLVKIEFLAK